MGALLWVKVPPQADHSERSEAQLHIVERLFPPVFELCDGRAFAKRFEFALLREPGSGNRLTVEFCEHACVSVALAPCDSILVKGIADFQASLVLFGKG